jgi:pimeloyl-ACP methyl ester carboxylesterase
MSQQTFAEGYFRSGQLTLHYLDWGNDGATPLVLLHHVNSQAHTWDAFARRMSVDYRVVALDMRGHGDSDWAGEGNYTTEQYSSDVAALVEHLGLEGIAVLGGSLGGRVALVYAAQHPELAAALIMEDVGAVRPPTISQGHTDRMAAGDPEFDTVEEWADQLRGQNVRTPTEYYIHNASYATKRLPNGRLGLKRDPMIQRGMVALELWNYVEEVRAPFMLLIGSESTIVDEDQQQRFRQIVPDISMVTVQDAGHVIVHDKLDEFESTVRNFLKTFSL